MITILISTSYFTLDDLIWKEEKSKLMSPEDQNQTEEGSKSNQEFILLLKSNKTMYLNTLLLGFTWFLIGFNHYGILHSWCKVSNVHKKFENDCLSALLGMIYTM